MMMNDDDDGDDEDDGDDAVALYLQGALGPLRLVQVFFLKS